MSGATQDRLAETREKINGARDLLAEVEKSPGSFDRPEHRKAEIREQLGRLQDLQVNLLQEFDGNGNGNGHGGHAHKAWEVEGLSSDQRVKTILDEVAASSAPFGRLPLGRSIGKFELARQLSVAKADVVAPPISRLGPSAGIQAQLRRPVSVLNLIPVGTMSGAAAPYVQESGSLTTAAETTEGATKPEGAAVYTDKQADAATIAHWLKVQKQSLSDVDGLQDAIANRLRDGVLRRLEDQIIAGNGTAPNLRGILATSGIQTVAFAGGATIVDQLIAGMIAVFSAGGRPDGVLLNPLDASVALTTKASTAGTYLGAPAFGGVFGLELSTTTIVTTAIPAGRALVGDFGRGAQLLIREGVNVLISDSADDDFTKNKVTLLGEMRAALPIWQPSLFADVDLAA